MLTGRIHRTWSASHVALLVVLVASAIWAYRDPLLDILLLGSRQADQSHVLLAPLVAGWLFWLRRKRLRRVWVRPSLLGPAIIAAAWSLHWWSISADVQFVWHASALLALLGCVLTVTGPDLVRRFWPAFLALVFFIPVPSVVQHTVGMPLQGMATAIMQGGFDVLGIPATREGFVLTINGEQIAVAEACNGMRMVLALGLVVYAFVFSVNLRPAAALLILGLSPLVALLCNVLRLVPTTILYGYSSAELAEHFHSLSGWAMLPIALFALIGVLRLIRWIELPVTPFRLAAA